MNDLLLLLLFKIYSTLLYFNHSILTFKLLQQTNIDQKENYFTVINFL